MVLHLAVEIDKIEKQKQEIVSKLVEEAKKVDGSYNSAVKYLANNRQPFLYKNDKEALCYFDQAVNQLDIELRQRVDFLKDKDIFTN